MRRIGIDLVNEKKKAAAAESGVAQNKDILSVLVRANVVNAKSGSAAGSLLTDEEVLSRELLKALLTALFMDCVCAEISTFIVAGHVTTGFVRSSPVHA